MRRSPRLKEANKGFKADCYTSKKCLACNPNPPDLSQVLIKKLGHNLYQIDKGLLSKKALNQKKKKSSKSVSKKALKENMKPSRVIFDAQDEEETLSQMKRRTKQIAAKKEAKKNKKLTNEDPDLQDEEGANPDTSAGAAPRKEMKE